MRIILAIASVASLLFCSPAQAQTPPDQEGSHDHPAIKRYPGSWIEREFQDKEFEEASFPVEDGAEGKVEKAEGKFFRAMYHFPPKASCTQVLRNFENAFQGAGMKVRKGKYLPEATNLSGARRWVLGVGKGKSGGAVYALQSCDEYNDPVEASGWLEVIETQKMEQKVEVASSDFMAEEIEKSGHVALYGINFATGKAEITPESAKPLEEIAKLLAVKPDWKLRVEGHTDNVGAAKANLDLSKKRAAAVKDWLVKKFKIDGKRLTTEGYGDTKPVGDNGTDDGKAKNRRVELVKL